MNFARLSFNDMWFYVCFDLVNMSMCWWRLIADIWWREIQSNSVPSSHRLTAQESFSPTASENTDSHNTVWSSKYCISEHSLLIQPWPDLQYDLMMLINHHRLWWVYLIIGNGFLQYLLKTTSSEAVHWKSGLIVLKCSGMAVCVPSPYGGCKMD